MRRAGADDVLAYVDAPDPVALRNEAVIEIAFAGVNFMDIEARQGTLWTELPNPKILGVDSLADAARAHADMESRRTTGKLLLVP